jgi:acyl transferase domain-containing protein
MTPNQQNSQQPRPAPAQPIAIVGMGAIMPQAPTAAAFWQNITEGRYCITDVPKDRWDADLYYDPDPRAPDKTYSRIGAWVQEFPWDPMGWRLPLPPRVSDQMDDAQKWSVAAAHAALTDAGWPGWNVDPERVAVVIGNALGGEKHYATNLRIQFAEFTRELARSAAFAALPAAAREAIIDETAQSFLSQFPDITEDTMPGELANIVASRVANLFNFRGPSYTTDAACASALAGLSAAAQGLARGEYDTVVTGGVDRNMGANVFVKFCKIGALSATGTRPFDAGADGFVMGEGAALFVLKRLADAERDGDRIYAVLLGVAGSSDGRGKGITAPNPAGQRLAIARAWQNAGADPVTASLIEAHGTSTRVGDAAELESLTAAFGPGTVAPGSIALGSVKSNIGHLKGAAGAAGLFKLAMAAHEKVLPPSLSFRDPNPNVDWAASPFRVNTELREWSQPPCGVRRGGVSAFGFGGTNFHAVVEEYVPGRYRGDDRRIFAGADVPQVTVVSDQADHNTGGLSAGPTAAAGSGRPAAEVMMPLRGALVVGGDSDAEVASELTRLADRAAAGQAAPPAPPDPALAGAQVRAAIDYGSPAELADKAHRAAKALAGGNRQAEKMLRARGVFIGRGPAPKVAFLYTGQGSQYVNMLGELRKTQPIVAETFAEADQITAPLLGKPLSEYIFIDASDSAAVARLEQQLLQTEITQPAVMASDLALTRLLAGHGVRPDMVMGHSVGEYGALMAAGSLSFEATLEAVSARGREMANIDFPDPGAMAAVMAPLGEIERILASADGYVVMANVNSNHQAVIGGATEAVEQAVAKFTEAGHTALRIPVSMAFHTSIVAPASEPLRRQLARLGLRPPTVPIVANVTGDFYPLTGPDVTEWMLDILGRQVASPVQFVKGLQTLYEAGARVFIEVGPKKALQGFADDVLGADPDVFSLFTNHPKFGDIPSFNAALCALYAVGLGYQAASASASGQAPANAVALAQGQARVAAQTSPAPAPAPQQSPAQESVPTPLPAPAQSPAPAPARAAQLPSSLGATMSADPYAEIGHLVAELLDRSRHILGGTAQSPAPGQSASPARPGSTAPALSEPVVITGAALGLPGTERVFDDENVARILGGQQFIDLIPRQVRHAITDKHITRLVKRDTGDPVFETIDSEADVIKLAGRYGSYDVVKEFGVDADRDKALDPVSRLAIGAGLDALRDAGIPLVRHYHTTTIGTQLPGRWGLPDELRDDIGVIFASAFPGLDSFADDLNHYHEDRAGRHELATLEDVRARMSAADPAISEVDRRIAELRHTLETKPFAFDRRFLFRALPMGHSQFAELIGARGPNTQVNGACASTAQALTLAEDWIRAGRCRRVVVVSADDCTSDTLLPWTGSGFLASGAAATDDVVEDAALPFDRRRHGMIIGAGAAALVVESAEAARERGVRPICEVLATVTANSAFHGTRLDVEHICQVMERLVSQAEQRGIDRHAIAGQTMFMSHETYTPARGGSASAEINALRKTFGPDADSIVIANTKGFTGHAMGAGIEEVVAVKALETGIIPPVPNFREIDPELGQLNLSRGGAYPVTYALRLAAGFGSQIAMALMRWAEPPDGRRHAPSELGFAYRVADEAAWRSWLARVSGRNDAELEVVQRRLRVRDDGMPAAPAAPAAAGMTISAAPVAVQDDGHPVQAPAAAAATLPARTALAATPSATAPAPSATTPAPPPVSAPQPAAVAAPARTAAAPPASAPVAEPAAPVPAQADPVEAAVVGIVERLTGYPRDLLDLDLDLEADLGVDTVKQAEVFAAVREQFGIPRDDNLKLRDFPTLAHVIGFVRDRATLPEPPPAPAAGAAATTGAAEVTGTSASKAPAPALIAVPAFTGDASASGRLPRRVPVPVLRPPAEACKPTGVTLDETKRVIVMADEAGVAGALVKRLGALGVATLVLEAGCATADIETQLSTWLADGPVHGVYWLAALDAEPAIAELDLVGWREALRRRVKNLYATVRCLDTAGQLGPRGTFLVAATRLGGYHGYDGAGAVAPLGGAVSGFTKAYRRERPDVLAKAVDFPASRKTAALADVLIEETQRDPGAMEIGRAGGRRFAVGLREVPFGDGQDGMALGSETVFAVTGAAGAIVSAIVADLAKASSGAFHLLDLTPEPDPADDNLILFATDKDALKKVIAERLAASGKRPTPVLIERELSTYERLYSAQVAIQAVREAGGKAYYHAVDLTDPAAVADVMTGIRDQHGRIDVLLHAAGLEISRAIADKEAREFDLVFDVKSDGLFNLLHAAGDLPIGAAVVFSSVAGRFGNAGQTDYSAANDLLCKIMSSFRTTRPGTRGIALDWTAWGGIGMATRGSIPKVMGMAGIDMLPPEAGIAWIGRELTAGPSDGEIVVAGKLGIMMAELDPTGGLDVTAMDTSGSGPMIGQITGMGVHSGLTAETILDPAVQPFLNDHRIDGTPVLPGVMGVEAFAALAQLAAPDLHVAGVEQMEYHSPVKFYRDEPRTLALRATIRPAKDGLVADCSLSASRSLKGDEAPRWTTHFTGSVRLTAEPPAHERDETPTKRPGRYVKHDDIYRVYFHGPAYQVLDEGWRYDGGAVGRLSADLPAGHVPQADLCATQPRLAELCFQTAGLWEIATTGQMPLPAHIDRVVAVGAPQPGVALFAVAHPASNGGFDCRVVNASGDVLVRMDGYRTVQVGPLADDLAAPIRSAIST